LPLHVAASTNNDICKDLLDVKETKTSTAALSTQNTSSSSPTREHPLCVYNYKGQTPVHVATEAKPIRIGVDRHYAVNHDHRKSESHEKCEVNKDNKTDFGLPTLKIMWGAKPDDDTRRALSMPDGSRRTCLHLAAAKGNSFSVLDYKSIKFVILIL
jgi:hypothetical protein